MSSGIYGIINVINKKIYIGSAFFIKKRWNQHRSDLNLNRHHNSHLQSAWNKYGELNFNFEIIEYCNSEELLNREKHYINQYNSKNREVGYNVNDPEFGFLGVRHTDETKKKLSLQKLGSKNPMFGKGLKGEEKTQSKLTNEDVFFIRNNHKKITNVELAKRFKVNNSLICMIGRRKRWTHI